MRVDQGLHRNKLQATIFIILLRGREVREGRGEEEVFLSEGNYTTFSIVTKAGSCLR